MGKIKAAAVTQSVTGFVCAQVAADDAYGMAGRVEIKSVNAHGLEMCADGAPASEIAQHFNVSRSTIWRVN